MDVFLARYPFLPQAGERVGTEVTLAELVGDRVYREARRRGRDRVLANLLEDAVEVPEPANDAEVLNDLLSYVVARILVSALEDEYVTRRYALWEAERVKAHLDREDPGRFQEVAAELGVDVEPAPGGSGADRHVTYRLHFSDYLRWAVKIKNREWKLINQPLEDGHIDLPQPKVARLLQEALRARIQEELPLPLDDELTAPLEDHLEAVREAAEERKGRFEADDLGEVDMDAFPPCMDELIGQLQGGANMSHGGRFAVAAFLSNIGMNADDILEVFSQTPDFREDLARYQIEHITGEGSMSGQEYTTPNCRTMKTNGICYNPDRWCKHTRDDGTQSVTNPLSYYRWALKRKDWAKRQESEGPESGAEGSPTEGGEQSEPPEGGDGGTPPGAPPEDEDVDESVPDSIRAQRSSLW